MDIYIHLCIYIHIHTYMNIQGGPYVYTYIAAILKRENFLITFFLFILSTNNKILECVKNGVRPIINPNNTFH